MGPALTKPLLINLRGISLQNGRKVPTLKATMKLVSIRNWTWKLALVNGRILLDRPSLRAKQIDRRMALKMVSPIVRNSPTLAPWKRTKITICTNGFGYTTRPRNPTVRTWKWQSSRMRPSLRKYGRKSRQGRTKRPTKM